MQLFPKFHFQGSFCLREIPGSDPQGQGIATPPISRAQRPKWGHLGGFANEASHNCAENIIDLAQRANYFRCKRALDMDRPCHIAATQINASPGSLDTGGRAWQRCKGFCTQSPAILPGQGSKRNSSDWEAGSLATTCYNMRYIYIYMVRSWICHESTHGLGKPCAMA